MTAVLSYNCPLFAAQQRRCGANSGKATAESLRDLQVDDEVEFRRLLEGTIGRIGALKDPIHITCGFVVNVSKVHAVGHESTEFCHLSDRVTATRRFW
jgi:hypothetical protein